MRITNDIRDFISKKVDAKVAKLSIEQDFTAAVALAERFAETLSNNLSVVAKKEFEDFLRVHPELANSELTSPITTYHRFHVAYSSSEIAKEYQNQLKMRNEYVDEVVQRVCIDATSCKDTEELLKLIDKIVGA